MGYISKENKGWAVDGGLERSPPAVAVQSFAILFLSLDYGLIDCFCIAAAHSMAHWALEDFLMKVSTQKNACSGARCLLNNDRCKNKVVFDR